MFRIKNTIDKDTGLLTYSVQEQYNTNQQDSVGYPIYDWMTIGVYTDKYKALEALHHCKTFTSV